MTPNPLQTLLLIWAAGGVLTRDGDNLHVEAPKGAIPPPLVDALRANKAALLAMLPARTATDPHPTKGVTEQ
jgi:hypothetical protein